MDSALTYEDIIRFLSRGDINQDCESCKTALWKVDPPTILTNGAAVTSLTLALLNSNAGALNSGGIAFNPVITLECSNCGFVRLYSYSFLKKWIANNPLINESQ